ncbi:MAG: hypothetical protein ACLFNW_12865 [Desulfobacterales bacterium]
MKTLLRIFGSVLLLEAAFAQAAHAYVGPGLGAGTLAVIAGIFVSVFLAVFAVVWYPLKRILARARGRKSQKHGRSPAEGIKQ